MGPKTKTSLRFVIPLFLAVFFGWYTFSKLPVSTIIPFVVSANYWWIILGVSFGFLSHLSRAYRWKYLLQPLGYQIKLPNSIMAVFITYLANYGVPRSGEVLRAAVLTNYEGVPFEKSFGTIVAERMADLIVMLVIIVITLILEFNFILDLLQTFFQPKKILLLLVVLIALIGIVILFLAYSKSLFASKVKGFIKGLLEGMLSVFRMEHKWAFIGHTLFIWVMYVLMFYVTTFALPELNTVSIGAILVAFISASFTIAATNGGIFVYPAAVMAAFTVFGIAKDPSFAFGWIMWSAQTIMVILLGSLSFIYLPIYNRTK